MTHYLMRNTTTQDLKLIPGRQAMAALSAQGWRLIEVLYTK